MPWLPRLDWDDDGPDDPDPPDPPRPRRREHRGMSLRDWTRLMADMKEMFELLEAQRDSLLRSRSKAAAEKRECIASFHRFFQVHKTEAEAIECPFCPEYQFTNGRGSATVQRLGE